MFWVDAGHFKIRGCQGVAWLSWEMSAVWLWLFGCLSRRQDARAPGDIASFSCGNAQLQCRWYCELVVWETTWTIEHLQHCYTIWTYTDSTVILIAILWQSEFLKPCHMNTEAMESGFCSVRFLIAWASGAGNAIADARSRFRAESSAMQCIWWRYVEIFGVLVMNIHEGSPSINGGALFTKAAALGTEDDLTGSWACTREGGCHSVAVIWLLISLLI